MPIRIRRFASSLLLASVLALLNVMVSLASDGQVPFPR
jgi:hypothetical protein